jgi:hypothetical protein
MKEEISMTHRHTDPHPECDHCFDHSLFEERQKILDKIPALITWMNINKGVFLLLAIILTIMMGVISNSRSEMKERQQEFESTIKENGSKADNQLLFISRDVAQIHQDVAVLVKTVELRQHEAEKEIENIKNKVK